MSHPPPKYERNTSSDARQHFSGKRLKIVSGAVDHGIVSTIQQRAGVQSRSVTEQAPRLGELLHNFRAELGETAKTVSRRCTLGPVELAQLELGRADLNADQLADAVAAYAVPRWVFPKDHCAVKVDLAAGTVSVHVSDAAIDETPADRCLLAYFELIGPGKVSPGTAVPFTSLDLDVLRLVLSSRRNEVNDHLHSIVGPLQEESPVATPHTTRRALLVLATAATVLAGAVIVHDKLTNQNAQVPIATQIGEPLVLVRESPDAPVSVVVNGVVVPNGR